MLRSDTETSLLTLKSAAGRPRKSAVAVPPAGTTTDNRRRLRYVGTCASRLYVAAGTELGEYYEYQKGGRQSLLLPVTAKDKIEYVFVLPVNAAAREFIWPGFDPITLRVD